MKYGKRQAALVFGTTVLSVALLGGVSAAAFLPVDAESTAHPERVEKAKPPLPDLETILDQLVVAGRITATQREAILAAVQQFQDTAEEKRAADATREPKAETKERAPKADKADEATKKDKQDKTERKSEQKLRIDVHKLLADSLRSAVAYLGLEAKAVEEQLRTGKSLADVAAANGKDRAGLIDAISAAADAKVDELTAQSTLTAEQAARTKTQVAEAAAKIADAKTSIRKVTAPGQAKKRG